MPETATPRKTRALDLLRTSLDHLQHERRYRRCRVDANPTVEREQREVLAALRETGVATIPGFLPAKECAAIRESIDACLEDDAATVWRDPVGADHRIFAFERRCDAARAFHRHPLLHAIAEAYCAQPIVNAFTLAGKLVACAENLGSGQGWHRDSFRRQFKAIVYLNDVDECGGPFEYLENSSSLKRMLHHQIKAGIGARANRIDPADVDRLAKLPRETLRVLTAPAGTLVLADTRGIHRGRPIETGARYALTNYYYPLADIDDAMAAHFDKNGMVDGEPLRAEAIRAFRPADA